MSRHTGKVTKAARGRAEAAALGAPFGGAVDLSGAKDQPVPLEGEKGEKQRELGEIRAGLRCGGCRKRFEKGWFFWTIEAFRMPDGSTAFRKAESAACSDPECAYAFEMGQVATAMRPIEHKFLDTPVMRKFFKSDAQAGERATPSAEDVEES